MPHRRLSRPTFVVLVVLAVGGLSGCVKKQPADLVLTNGKIITLEEIAPTAEALAVAGDRIVAVGTAKKIKPFIGTSTRVIDLQGQTAIPGFIDSHAHFTGVGEARMILDLTRAKNWDEIVSIVAEAARNAKPGEWIRGRGWHQEKWDKTPEPNVDGLPFHDALSRMTSENPVLLEHASGHSCLANAKAMELGGITKTTPDPAGGEIVRDARGNPIGAFRETAQGLIGRSLYGSELKKTEAERVEEERKAIALAVQECLSKGITSLHDAGASFATIDIYRELAEQGKLGVRIYAMISAGNTELQQSLARYRIIGAGQNHLTVRTIKRFIDGALGAHGAWLLEPYADLPASAGLNTMPIDTLKETARLAIENGFQLCTHAIGDRGNREILNIYEEAFAAHPEQKDLRWRVEHAQHLAPADIPRFGRLGVIAAMQGVHCISDGPWVVKKIGEKRAKEGAYVWRSLMEGGAIICNGTDAPVEDVDPIPSFYATVTRKMKDGTMFFPEQRLSRDEALRTYTLNGAYAAFQEDLLGSLKPGKLADITVLSKDIMTVAEEEIPATEVRLTIVGGQVLYQKN
ncbi:MAG: amidohydrolase [Candidatus Aminicenantes bacterium RBG_19FT_COMBO_58_17]|nr:MAG: amidohydrolase [Candidatus Aminicenantes bacterium RBG_19FT_COMBO_58_17]